MRLDTDGYAQIEPLTQIVDIMQTSTVTHLKVNVNVNENSYQSSSMKKFSSSLNTPITSTRKTGI